jgi:quercetin dioxygenase-like cupin family protein
MPDTLKLSPDNSVIVRRSEPAVLEVEGIWAPGGSPPPKHFHPDQDEKFRVLIGTLHVRVDGEERVLRQGEVIEIPRRAVHQMWNPGEREARASWETRPAGRTEEWFRAIDSLHRDGRVGENEMPKPLDLGALLSEYQDVFRLAVAPQLLVRPVVAGLGAIGRARGRRPTS